MQKKKKTLGSLIAENNAEKPKVKRKRGLTRPDRTVAEEPREDFVEQEEETEEVPARKKKRAGSYAKPIVMDLDDINKASLLPGKSDKKQPAALKKIKDKNTYFLYLQSSMTSASENSIVSVRGTASRAHLVMPLPLPLQITMQVNGIPYGTFIEVAGDKGSLKSSFVLGMARIFNGFDYSLPDHIGFADYVSNESKYPDGLVSAICGYEDEHLALRPDSLYAVKAHRSGSMNEWQKIILSRLKEYEKLADPKRGLPYLIILDSITAKLLDSTAKKIVKEGMADRAFSIEADSIRRFMATVMNKIEDYPIVFMGVNHVRRDKEIGKFAEVRSKPGGRYLSYQEIFDLDMKQFKKPWKINSPDNIDYAFIHMNATKLTVEKSSIGQTFNSCVLYYSYTYSNYCEMPDGSIIAFKSKDPHVKLRQRSKWEWGRSLCNKIATASKDIVGKQRAKLNDVCRVDAANELVATCKQISKVAMDSEKLGRLIMQDERMCEKIADIFAVQQYPVYEPGTDYCGIRGIERKKKSAKELSDSE
jgi:hypothetical protein